jgi:hypothetical protein
VSEFTASVHLLLDPDDGDKVHVDARQHPDAPDTFFVQVDTLHCHLAISGHAEPVLTVVERMRTELHTTFGAAGRHDLTDLTAAAPATQPAHTAS